MSDWSVEDLRHDQLAYAAMDVYALKFLILQRNQPPITPSPQPYSVHYSILTDRNHPILTPSPHLRQHYINS
ncbi:unnamed protein product [Caenorhabditis nigoni]